MKRAAFSKQDSQKMKGIAILMMMWHHCFLAGRYESYNVSFFPLAESQAVNVAVFFKICVSVFAFISGYGMWTNYKKTHTTTPGIWVLNQYVRTMSPYWFVVVLSWVICMAIDQRPLRAYELNTSMLYGAWNMGLELLGLRNLFGVNCMNGTWWYMSAAVMFIVLTPLLYNLLQKFNGLLVTLMIFALPRIFGGNPGGTHFYAFLPAFCFGMIFAQIEFFELWDMHWSRIKATRIAVGLRFIFDLIVAILAYKLYYFLLTNTYWDVKYGIIPLAIIILARDFVINIPAIGRILQFLGKHATNVFLVHTFIRYYYCEAFTYSMKHFALIIFVLLVISVALSILIENFKTLVRYDSLIEKLLKGINEVNYVPMR